MAYSLRNESYETVFDRTSMVIKDIMTILINRAGSDGAITDRQMTTNIMLITMNELFPLLEHMKCLAHLIGTVNPYGRISRTFGVDYLLETLRNVRIWLISGEITPVGIMVGLEGILGSLPF
ncbi:uncharacterized protein N7511_006440 [Penicillium nucicola]|uniref:uncharacterized protein n=1 Tax=Penicillium nucicola TaxID=1850975 RepID=UPI0025450A87|nr:uncharacterized protein N7511_006440 [Penicillium nucicola]KAJ5757746.1 hypothetical protein N7511_006440 [Penicillium nucicola]